MISSENLTLLLNFVVGILKITAIPLSVALVTVALLRKKKVNR